MLRSMSRISISRCKTLPSFSNRAFIWKVSSTSCLSVTPMLMLAATMSASRPASSTPRTVRLTSGRNFLVQLDVAIEQVDQAAH